MENKENLGKNIIFKDVPDDHWANEAIYNLASRGIVSGYPDGTFRPDEPITRAEAASIQMRYIESKSEN